jgi:hypothetical protein
MKIIILVPFVGNNKPDKIENCKTRFQVFAYYIFKYLSKFEYITVILSSCPHRGKTELHQKLVKNFVVPDGDHLILVDEGGFYARPKEFKTRIRMKIYGAICSVGLTNVYLGEEDILFYISPFGLQQRKNTLCLGWLSDSNVVTSNKLKNTINVLISYNLNQPIKEIKEIKILDTIYEFVRSNRKNGSNVIMKQLLDEGTKILELSRKIEESGKMCYFTNYKDRFDLYSESNIFFLLDRRIDKLTLVEMAMANIIIVSPKDYLDNNLINLLNIITYVDTIDWNEIVTRLNNNNNTREKLLSNNHCWSKGINNIVEFLNEFKLEKVDQEAQNLIIKEKEIKKEIIIKKKPHIINKLSNERDKKPTLIQSHLYFAS